jgi:hypothetical protein
VSGDNFLRSDTTDTIRGPLYLVNRVYWSAGSLGPRNVGTAAASADTIFATVFKGHANSADSLGGLPADSYRTFQSDTAIYADTALYTLTTGVADSAANAGQLGGQAPTAYLRKNRCDTASVRIAIVSPNDTCLSILKTSTGGTVIRIRGGTNSIGIDNHEKTVLGDSLIDTVRATGYLRSINGTNLAKLYSATACSVCTTSTTPRTDPFANMCYCTSTGGKGTCVFGRPFTSATTYVPTSFYDSETPATIPTLVFYPDSVTYSGAGATDHVRIRMEGY